MRTATAATTALVTTLLALASCATTDGVPFDTAVLGEHTCAVDLDCGPGRHCGEGGVCAIECVTAKDCAFTLSTPDATNDLACSPCGRCVARGTHDSRCLSPVAQPCASADDCRSVLGDGYQCGASALCERLCATDDECKNAVGRGWGCGTASAPRVCVRSCFREQDCVFHGWQYGCHLPDGVDPKTNEEAASPVFGQCVASASVPGFKPPASSDPPAAAYQGVWGFMMGHAVRLDGVPILTRLNSVSVEHLLVRVTWNGNDLTFDEKWCDTKISNFNDDDSRAISLVNVIVPDRNVDAVLVRANHALSVPALAAGASFATDTILDIRGTRLPNPDTDPLPTYKDLTNQWDQDRDGQPGLTANTSGVFTGDLYQAQRVRILFNMKVVDANHLHGLLTGSSEATILGATKPDLVNDAVTSKHPQFDRSYFRAVRLADDASCNDVLALGAIEGGWLAYDPHFDETKTP